MKRTFVLLFFGLCIAHSAEAQVKIGDNPQNIDAASVLELESTDKVLVITRVTTAQMNAIVPLQGAMVYNTDVQGVHYFDGTQWVNIGGGGGADGPHTAEAIVNVGADPTIVITPTANGDNFEVAPGSISSAQIANGGINGTTDILDNSIGNGKLQDQSVTQEKLSENSVGAFALDNDNIGVSAFNNDVGYITSANIVSTDGGNALQIGTDNGAFYDEAPLINAIQDNADAIALDNDQSSGNEIQNLTLDNTTNILSLSGSAGTVDLSPYAGGGGSDDQNIGPVTLSPMNILSIGIEGGMPGTVDLSSLSGGGGNPTDELTDISFDDTTNILTLSNPATVAGSTVDLSPLAGGGATQNLAQVLTTGSDGGASLIKNILDPVDPQDAATRAYVDATVASGGSLNDGTILIGGAGDAAQQLFVAGDATLANTGILTISPDAIVSSKILNATILAADLNNMGAMDGEILKWNDATTSWVTAADDTGTATLNDGNIYVGNASNAPTGVVMSGDATIDNAGELTIQNDAVELNMIAQNGATADGEIIQWNTDINGDGSGGGWEVAANAGHTGDSKSIFFAGADGAPTQFNHPVTGRPSLYWDYEGRTLSGTSYGALAIGVDGDPQGGVTPTLSNEVKVHIAEKLSNRISYSLLLHNSWDTGGATSGSGVGMLFASDRYNDGKGALVFERRDNWGVGDFHFLQNNVGARQAPDLATDKAFTITRDKDIRLYRGIDIDGVGFGTAGQVLASGGTGNPLQWVDASGLPAATTDGQVITWDEDAVSTTPLVGAWVAGTGGAGETNTASNIGTVGVGPFIDKNGADLRFKTINGLDTNIITVTEDAANSEIDLDIRDGSIPFSKLTPATPTTPVQVEQVLVSSADGTAISWQPRSSGGTNLATDDLTQDIGEDRTYDLNGNNLIFTGSGRIGVGTTNPLNKFHVAGEIRSEGFNSTFGTVGAPAYSFASATTPDGDTGMYRPAADQIGFSVGGFEALRFDEYATGETTTIINGRLELDAEVFDTAGNPGTSGQVLSSTGGGTAWVNAGGSGTLAGDVTGPAGTNVIANNAVNSIKIADLSIQTIDLADSSISTDKIQTDAITAIELANNSVVSTNIVDNSIMNVDINGSAAIDGSKINPNFGGQSITNVNNVTVTGSIFRGPTNLHPDYVFQKYFLGNSELNENYDFKALAKIEAFVKKHHHLPGIKSAKQVKEEGVWNISESNLQNLEKIEELFLHTIEQEHKIKKLESENRSLTEELEAMHKDLKEIKALLKNK